MTLDDLRRHAVARSLFRPVTLQRALDRLGFVQADPIRAPARAQDLTLRHRVTGYRSGDLERQYTRLDVHEDFFVNYGFVSGPVSALMHPRGGPTPWSAARGRQVRALLDFVRSRGEVHPREVDGHFALGSVTNYWGGSSSATTHLLDQMHYRGLLRVVRRDAGIRVYAAHAHDAVARDAATRRARLDALVDVVVAKYAPLTASGLNRLVKRLRYGVPQWAAQLDRAVQRARHRLAHAQVDGVSWYWPADENPAAPTADDAVRLLAPFDPVVWDRPRFELLWDWEYRFEAYTPVPKRKLGTTRSRSCGATRSWAGPTSAPRTAGSSPASAMSRGARRASVGSVPRSTRNCSAWQQAWCASPDRQVRPTSALRTRPCYLRASLPEEARMRIVNSAAGLAAGAILTGAAAVAQAQVMFPQAGCKATPAELEANKKVAMEFFRPGISGPDRVALADPTYKQHNPAFVKGGGGGAGRLRLLQVALWWTAAPGWPRPGTWPGRWPPAAGRQPDRDRDGRVRRRQRHSQELPPGPDRCPRHVVRGVHVRHVPRAQRQAGGALGRRGDQSAGAARGRGSTVVEVQRGRDGREAPVLAETGGRRREERRD